jgi:Bacterial membrane protein YfhO
MPKLESDRSFWLLVIAVFALLTGLNYFPVLVGKIPFPRDMVLQFPAWSGTARSGPVQSYADIGDLITAFYPFRAFASRSVHAGTLPLWNPYFQGGVPFQADSQSSLFYPANVLYYILPLPIAWTLCLLLRMFLAGLFMTIFVRSIDGTKTGAIFSGIVFASCGFITAWQGQPLGDASIWLPLISYAVLRLHRNRTKSSLALTGFAFAMPVLAGHPETAAHVTLVGIMIAGAEWLASTRPRPGNFNVAFPFAFAVGGVLALGLAAIQIIPTLEWLGQMNEAFIFQWPPLPLHQVLAWVSRDALRGPNSAGVWVPQAASYVGMITLLAAPLAAFQKPRRHTVTLGIITFVGLSVAYGLQPVQWLFAHMPILGGLKNDRMILLADFGIAALGGLGISVLQNESFVSRRWIASCFVGAAFIIAFVFVYKLQAATQFRVEFLRRPSFSRSLLLLGAIPIAWRLGGGLRGRLFPLAVCGLAAFDLITFSFGYMGFARTQEIFPPAPAFDFLARQDDRMQFRIAISGSIPYSANANLIYEIPSADGYEVSPSWPRLFAQNLSENRWDALSFIPEAVLKSTDRRIDMLNVKYLVLTPQAQEFPQFAAMDRYRQVFNNGHVVIFENKRVLPRAFVVPASGIEILENTAAEFERVKSASFDPERSVILSEVPSSQTLRVETAAMPFSGHVEMIDFQINQLSLRATTSTAAALVLSQIWFPGWRATVDGEEVPVLRANASLTGILLPAGSHEVRFIFRPLSFVIGAVITILTAVVLVALIITRA